MNKVDIIIISSRVTCSRHGIAETLLIWRLGNNYALNVVKIYIVIDQMNPIFAEIFLRWLCFCCRLKLKSQLFLFSYWNLKQKSETICWWNCHIVEMFVCWSLTKLILLVSIWNWDCRRDHMVVGFTTTYAVFEIRR